MSHIVPPDVHRMVTDAITTIRSGDKARGQMLLAQALRIDPRNETAWLWMASLAETPERQRECLERALAINPNNETARRALQKLSDPQPPHATLLHQTMPDEESHVLSPSAPQDAQTSTQPERTSQERTNLCPQCGAPLGATDTFCSFCGTAFPFTSGSSSYPKRTPLTRKEQLRLAAQSTIRCKTASLFSATTVVGTVLTCIGIAGAFISPWITSNGEFPGVFSFLPSLMWMVFLIPGVPNMVKGVRMYRFAQSLRHATTVAEAPILNIWQEMGYDTEPYIVAWELTVVAGDGTTMRYRQAQQIGKKMYHLLQTHETVRVRYVPEKPDISGLDEQWEAGIRGASGI
ncbi:MAG: zinc-ribbon domain-containing protein [Roseiflexus sp.]